MPFIKENTLGVKFRVFVQPRSSQNTIVGRHGDALKIKLTAPPVDNAANKMCVKFLAKCLQVPKSRLEILSGHTGRKKLLILKYADEKKATVTDKESMKQQISALFDPEKTP